MASSRWWFLRLGLGDHCLGFSLSLVLTVFFVTVLCVVDQYGN